METLNDSSRNSGMDNSRLVSFSDAARFLGLDIFTFYSLAQCEEIPLELGSAGEFLVSQEHLNRLAGRSPHAET